MTEAAITAIGLFALYLLFTGQTSAPEIGAGILCALVAVAFRVQVRRQAEKRLYFRLGWWPRLTAQVAASLASDTLRVGLRLFRLALGRNGPGHEAEQGFQPGGFTPQAAGYRSVTVLATSMAPDSFVLQVEPDAIRLHRLVGGSDAVNTP
jgi:hypothetical protein